MGLMANLRQFSSIFRRKFKKNAVFHRKKPAIGENARAFREKKPRAGPLRLQSGGGGSRRSRAFSACAAGKAANCPIKA